MRPHLSHLNAFGYNTGLWCEISWYTLIRPVYLVFSRVRSYVTTTKHALLHRLLNNIEQVLAQLIQVYLIAQRGAEGLHDLSCIILTAVEASINDRLNTMT